MKHLNYKIVLLRRDIKNALSTLSGMLGVKAGRGWIQWLLKVTTILRGGNTRAVARSAVYFVRVLRKIYLSEGLPGVVLKTKAWYVLTMQSTGGMRIPAAQQLGCAVARTRSGLPRVIPSEMRKRINQGDRVLLRIWVSWFSIYRVLQVPGTLKLKTITQPGLLWSKSLTKESLVVIAEFCKFLGYGERGSAKADLPSVQYIPLSKSTPSVISKTRKISGSAEGIISGAYALVASPVIDSWRWLADFVDPIPSRRGGVPNYSIGQALDQVLIGRPPSEDLLSRPVGKIGLKLEAAGKVRVFAMVECWTQWLLHPLHSFIFKLLGRLKTDGTVDQFAPVSRLQELGHQKFWCFDLSAATDRLPVDLQASFLDHFFGDGFGWNWKNLLVGREYVCPVTLPSGVKPVSYPRSVHYAVGQPMGALSSWAMLALTHHLIVAWAARRVGHPVGTFWDYAVLGDDILICDGRVAGAYLQLMAQIGVEIGVAKSLVSSNGTLEFAKRFHCQGVDCSPVPFKEIVAALHNFESSTQLITKYQLGARSIAALVGYGYRVRGRLVALWEKIPRKLATIGVWRSSPWGSHPHNWNSWLNIRSFVIRPEWLVQDTEMWPDLPKDASSPFKKLASKDEERLERLRADLPTRGVYSGSRWMTKWMEQGLYDLIRGLKLSESTGKAYNALYFIQSDQWKDSIPALKRDLKEVADVLMRIRTNTRLLPDHLVTKWVSNFRLVGRLAKPRTLGMVVKLRETPSILAATRLWRFYDNKRGSKGA